MHEVFNRKPASLDFMNAEGGDDADLITENLFLLIKSAKQKGILLNKYFHIGDVLFKKSEYFQGVDLAQLPDQTRIEKAFYLWRQCPPKAFKAVMESNGYSLEPPFGEGITVTLKDDGTYVTVVEIGDFDVENRGSFTMVFEPERDVGDILNRISALADGRDVLMKDLRSV